MTFWTPIVFPTPSQSEMTVAFECCSEAPVVDSRRRAACHLGAGDDRGGEDGNLVADGMKEASLG
jgi:hypothetical protein